MRLAPLTRLASSTFAGLVVVSVSLVACSSSPTENAVMDDAGSAPIVGSSVHPGPSGAICNQITETYALCEDLSTCPGVGIDPNAFPDCGYSIHNDLIDPECLCYGYACPMGAPQNCGDMAALLVSGVSQRGICENVLAGHCRDLGADGTPSDCQICKDNCYGIQTCIWACGC